MGLENLAVDLDARDNVPTVTNRLLRLLPWDELDRLQPHLERLSARSGLILVEPDQPFEYVYFPVSCVISVVSPTDEGMVEVGTVGNEGMAGISVFLGVGALPNRTVVQVPGELLRMRASVFAEAVESRAALQRLVLRYTHAFLVQVAQTAACNRVHDIEARCARWLLMTHDRVSGAPSFNLTHEFLATMLGVRRAGVTVAAGALQRAGLLRYSRGVVTVLDRAGLESASCQCYGIVEKHFKLALS
jgi:CRP-like cAMP-binding protein